MRKTVLALLLLLMVWPAPARRQPRYPFIRPDLNVLQTPSGESPELQHFFRKLDTLLITGRGDVRVLHVGGSHVQGGTLSDRLRRHFLSMRYGMEGGRGLVFPSAKVILDLVPRERQLLQQRYVFNRVDVLGSGTLEPILLLNGRDTLRGIGTENLRHFDIPYYTDWVQLAFTGQGRYSLRGLYLDKPYGGFSLSEVGVNGASTHSWLRCNLWEQEMHRVMPDLVIFSIGINDIQGEDFDARRFKGNYRELIKRVRRVNPRCAILFTGINDSWRHRAVNPHTAAAEKAFQELAQEFDAAFWDWYGVMGGAGSMARWEEAGLAQADKIHFTPAGYKLVGDLLFDALMDAYYGR